MPGTFGSFPINIQNSAAPSTPSGGVNLYSNNSNLILQTPSSTYTVQQNPVWTINSAPALPNGTSTSFGNPPIILKWSIPSSLQTVLANGYPLMTNPYIRLDYCIIMTASNNSSPSLNQYVVATFGPTPTTGILNTITTTTNQQVACSSSISPLSNFNLSGPYDYLGIQMESSVAGTTWNVTGYQQLLLVSLYTPQS